MKKILIIDFGAGNIHSIKNAVAQIVGEENIVIVEQVSDFVAASHIILPGVGAFDRAMYNLKERKNLIGKLSEEVINNKVPLLGICIGMQVLADIGYENKTISGLGWISGEVKPLPTENLIVPHMGWNNINIINNKDIYKKFSCFDKKDFYFVHSYYFDCMKSDNIIAEVKYGILLPAIIAVDNIIATQFHPEKSGENGLEFLKIFLQVEKR